MSKKINRIDIMTITISELKEKLSKLDVITAGKEAKNNQRIEGIYGDASFGVTKEEFAGCVLWVLRVVGPSNDARLHIISRFKELLDSKPIEFPAGALLNTDSLFWNAKIN